jgi:hypothetical protein
MNSALRPHVTAGVGLIGAGIVAVTPITAPLTVAHAPEIQLTADGEDAQDIVIDIVRHGQRMPPADLEDTQSPPFPGVPLSELGQQQAQDVGQQLFTALGPHVAGIFSGQAIRDQETAAPFAGMEHMTPQILPGIDEVDPGIYGGQPQLSLDTLLYVFTTLMWTAGNELATIPDSIDTNGVVFDQKFTGAVDTMYSDAMANPVVSANSQITDVAFNNEESIVDWVLMNVKNPDLSVILSTLIQSLSTPAPGFLPNGGVVQIEGNPTDGWTLVSWNGDAVPQDPGLATELWVDFRDLIQAPQTAAWNIFEAAQTGDATTFDSALQAGFSQVGAALTQFSESVFNDIAGAFSEGESLSEALPSSVTPA